MQDHLTSLQGLQKLVDSVIDSSRHPHAVDGQQLQCIQAAAVGNMAKADAPNATTGAVPEGIDIVQLLQVSSANMPINNACRPTAALPAIELKW